MKKRVIQILPVNDVLNHFSTFDEKGKNDGGVETEKVRFLIFVEVTDEEGEVYLQILPITRADINIQEHDLVSSTAGISNFIKSEVI